MNFYNFNMMQKYTLNLNYKNQCLNQSQNQKKLFSEKRKRGYIRRIMGPEKINQKSIEDKEDNN